MKKILGILMILLLLQLLSGCIASTSVVEKGPLPPKKIEDNHETPVDTTAEEEEPDSVPEQPEQLEPDPEPITEQKPVFEYPDAVRGIYVTGHSAGGERLEKLIQLVNETDLNAMVIDVKDDYGNITFKLDGTPFEQYGKNYIKDPAALLEKLAEHNIYPIARVVVFKDSTFAAEHPEFSFQQNGKVWKNTKKEAFINPFIRENWEHNVLIAKEAAKIGFKEIQFDYVRFPEGFEKKAAKLTYSLGEYSKEKLLPRLVEEWESIPAEIRPEFSPEYDPVQARVAAVTDFVKYAYEEMKPFDVEVSVDIFGYSATVSEAPGIGQNFIKISENVDVISSMIYPSHWSIGYFNIPKPDKEPYRLVKEYVLEEKGKFSLMDSPPRSRPWIQDFTAPWLGEGYYIKYGKAEVEAQIRALGEGGITEFLLWNPLNRYTANVDYTPELQEPLEEQIQNE